MSKAKKWEPKTFKGYCVATKQSSLAYAVYSDMEMLRGMSVKVDKVRIIREKDYQKLLRLAHKKESRNG